MDILSYIYNEFCCLIKSSIDISLHKIQQFFKA